MKFEKIKSFDELLSELKKARDKELEILRDINQLAKLGDEDAQAFINLVNNLGELIYQNIDTDQLK